MAKTHGSADPKVWQLATPHDFVDRGPSELRNLQNVLDRQQSWFGHESTSAFRFVVADRPTCVQGKQVPGPRQVNAERQLARRAWR